MNQYQFKNLSLLNPFVKVRFVVDEWSLNKKFKKGEQILINDTFYYSSFPIYDPAQIKKAEVKRILSANHEHDIESLYFHCKVFEENTNNLLFEYEDHFEEDEQKRTYVKVLWDKKLKALIGIKHFTNGIVADPRTLPPAKD